MHRRILAVVTALALLAALTACGTNETAETTAPQTTAVQTTASREAEGDIASPQAQPQTQPPETPETSAAPPADASTETQPAQEEQQGQLFQKFVRDKVKDGTYTLRTEQKSLKISMVVDGENSMVESDAAGVLRLALVHRDGNYYMIMHTTKKYAQMSEEEYNRQAGNIGSATMNLDGMRFRSSGTQTVNGKSYSTETYDEGDGGVVTYFFDETGVRRTRAVKNGTTTDTDVFLVSDDADASAFEIPAGYTLVEDPALLLA